MLKEDVLLAAYGPSSSSGVAKNKKRCLKCNKDIPEDEWEGECVYHPGPKDYDLLSHGPMMGFSYECWECCNQGIGNVGSAYMLPLDERKEVPGCERNEKHTF
mmetsp:Transcript_13595/g.25786  ORF Transcript_13595/g.25786 Transcript_13595/m.25786 type:complete len:103 (+) Transcript_13595:53-361(+)